MGLAELTRNAVDVLPEGGLERKLALGRPLRVKLGIDVTSPDIHVGRGIPLQRMRAFQDEGHTGVLIVGDYTTRIGDPSGRSAERPILYRRGDRPQRADATSSRRCRSSIPSAPRCGTTASGSSKLSYADVVRLARTMTVARILERDDFAKRYAASEPISVSELLYPLMQAYDSVAVEADVELGGTDQLYNLLAGREVMERYGLEPQVALTTPLLNSWDGTKMSSSRRQQHPAAAPPEEHVRPDDADPRRAARASGTALVAEQPAPEGDPLEAKLELARFIVARSHGEEAARAAEEHFTRVVREGQAPEEVPRRRCRTAIPCTCRRCSRGSGSSTSEARRLIAQGGVKIDGEAVDRARRAARTARRRAPAGRQAPLRAFARLTRYAPRLLLPFPGRPTGRRKKVPDPTQERHQTRLGYDAYRASEGLWRESEAFLRAAASGAVFENSTACFTSRPRGRLGLPGREDLIPSVLCATVRG